MVAESGIRAGRHRPPGRFRLTAPPDRRAGDDVGGPGRGARRSRPRLQPRGRAARRPGGVMRTRIKVCASRASTTRSSGPTSRSTRWDRVLAESPGTCRRATRGIGQRCRRLSRPSAWRRSVRSTISDDRRRGRAQRDHSCTARNRPACGPACRPVHRAIGVGAGFDPAALAACAVSVAAARCHDRERRGGRGARSTGTPRRRPAARRIIPPWARPVEHTPRVARYAVAVTCRRESSANGNQKTWIASPRFVEGVARPDAAQVP